MVLEVGVGFQWKVRKKVEWTLCVVHLFDFLRLAACSDTVTIAPYVPVILFFFSFPGHQCWEGCSSNMFLNMGWVTMLQF